MHAFIISVYSMISILSLISAFLLSVSFVIANQVQVSSSPSGVRARELIAKAQQLLRKSAGPKSMLSDEGSDTSSLSNAQIAGIAVGGAVVLGLVIYVVYRYRTWVPKTRAAKGPTSSPSSPASGDDRQRLIVAGTTAKQ